VFDLGAVRQAHDRFMKANSAMIGDVLDRAGKEAFDHVRDKAKFRHRSGRTWRSTSHRVRRNRGGGRVSIRNTSPYAGILEKGSKKHPITAKRKRVLRFYSAAFGGLIFRRRVVHRGTRPYRFLSAARDHAFHWSRSTLQARMRRLARSF
jgi:hypothetical protein